MAAASKTCTLCGDDFHGRADAAYCSAACRQKAYRARSRNETASRDVTDMAPSWRKHHSGRAPVRTIAGRRPATLARNITNSLLIDAASLSLGLEDVYLDEIPVDIATPDHIDEAIENIRASLAFLTDLQQRAEG